MNSVKLSKTPRPSSTAASMVAKLSSVRIMSAALPGPDQGVGQGGVTGARGRSDRAWPPVARRRGSGR